MTRYTYYYLILVNVLVLFFMEITKFFISNEVLIYMLYGAQYGPVVSSGEWYRIATAMFVHGGFIHIAFNMYALFYLGRIVESVYGTDKFLNFYFITGLVGNLATHLFYYDSFSVGASGAIFGLVGVLFAAGFRKDTPYMLKPLTGTALLPIVIVNLVLGFMPGTNINNAAHIGGFLSGMLLGYLVPIYGYSIKFNRLWKISKWGLVGFEVLAFVLLLITDLKNWLR
ncbi:rhomboid family intramembrane serine protease [Thermosipho ferrireducens]|uniref:Rhomboid family intramembrane serine protease n=1 Tax=Thermosipho ferrireducens TaxID=2571116 RepID=A0ABX7S5X0_9BACT|nr:rhomboid family intramembrane serine protease [Thermosipho ferrireducens]QTA37238.1 rhomboid family intramembrane serine protease [Thermosipho ferrireducens]